METPLVSVVIPSFNSGRLLENAIKSVINQTYKNIEIIIVDDGSTDGTKEWLVKNSLGIKYYFQKNSGAASARNTGVSLATGEYIAFLDADDIWLPTKLEKQIELINIQNSFIFSNGYIIEGEYCYEDIIVNCDVQRYRQIYKSYTWPPKIVDFNRNFKIHSVPTSSILVRKSLFEQVNGFPNLKQGEDFVFLQLLLSLKPAISIDIPLMAYRVHNKNTSSSLKQSTFIQRLDKIFNKDKARIELYHRLCMEKMVLPKIIRTYEQAPLFFRMLLLFFWRVKFGSSLTKVKNDLFKYLFGR